MQRSFTLIQYTISIAIISALALLAQPNYRQIKQSNLSVIACKNLQQALQYARLQAINQRTVTSLAPVSYLWADGFKVMQGRHTLKTYSPKKNLLITWHGFSDRQNKITVLANGMTHNNGHFIVVAKSADAVAYQLLVSKTMQTRVTVYK